MSVAVMVLALSASLAQHFELNWKLLILLLSVTAKTKKTQTNKKTIQVAKSPPSAMNVLLSGSMNVVLIAPATLLFSWTLRFKGDFPHDRIRG